MIFFSLISELETTQIYIHISIIIYSHINTIIMFLLTDHNS